MNQIRIVTIMLALVLPADLACLDLPHGRQTRTPVEIVGTWQLVSRIDRTSRGELVPEPELRWFGHPRHRPGSYQGVLTPPRTGLAPAALIHLSRRTLSHLGRKGISPIFR